MSAQTASAPFECPAPRCSLVPSWCRVRVRHQGKVHRCVGARPGRINHKPGIGRYPQKKGGQSAMLVRIRTIPPDLPPCFRIVSGMAPTSRIVGSERGPSWHSSQATQGKRRPFHFKRLTPIDRHLEEQGSRPCRPASSLMEPPSARML